MSWRIIHRNTCGVLAEKTKEYTYRIWAMKNPNSITLANWEARGRWEPALRGKNRGRERKWEAWSKRTVNYGAYSIRRWKKTNSMVRIVYEWERFLNQIDISLPSAFWRQKWTERDRDTERTACGEKFTVFWSSLRWIKCQYLHPTDGKIHSSRLVSTRYYWQTPA